MGNENEVEITTRDKILKAWQDSMELVRDFKSHANEISDNEQATKAFEKFAEDEGLHAARFREILQQYHN